MPKKKKTKKLKKIKKEKKIKNTKIKAPLKTSERKIDFNSTH